MTSDEVWMRRAIGLAAGGIGRTGENPSVGCVIVAGEAVVGEGATGPGGRPHAEESALDAAGDAARGAVAYVTLEPCAQRSAGHASCSERLASAGVGQVVVACPDPSVMAAGRGLARLAEAGVAVTLGLLADEAMALYADYRPREA